LTAFALQVLPQAWQAPSKTPLKQHMPEEGGAAGMSASDPRMPEHMETQRTHVICGPDLNYHVSTVVLQAQRPLPAAGKLKTPFVADFFVDISKYVHGTRHK